MNYYQSVSSKVNFDELEQEVIKYWNSNNIFEASLQQRIDENAEEFVFFEGPPTANGRPGIHHVLARTFKDLICRYQTMQGKLVKRNAGWDEHGLPVEIEVQKNNNLKSKDDIENLGIDKFNNLCANSTQKYIHDWQKLTERMAYWVNFDKAYRTSSPEYISNVWSILKHLHDKDMLYSGYKIVPWACDSGTTVSQAEVSLGYKDIISESAYVKFELKNNFIDNTNNNKIYMVAWTTTPWTLPSNMMLALGKKVEYTIAQNIESSDYIIISNKRIEKLLNIEEYKIIESLTGQELINKLDGNNNYCPLVDLTGEFADIQTNTDCYSIHLANFVEDGEDIGTGIVHCAPAFGQDDNDLFNSLKQQEIISKDLAIINLITPEGYFTENSPEWLLNECLFNEIKKSTELEFKRINNIIVKSLKADSKILLTEKYEHTYPHNWRTNNPLIYYLRPSWYVSTQSIRDNLIEANQQVNWYPGHIKDGRFGKWLENNIDWSISRERYWGTPLPIWTTQDGSKTYAIGSIQELEELSGQKITDPHKHIVDNIKFTIDGEEYTRVSEVIDCWFDSGAMPIASFNKNNSNPTNIKTADYICEAIDQTRGWFYSLLAIAVACNNTVPYKNVLCLGHILDKTGQKMSKSKGNIEDPWALFEQYGVDAIRWYFVQNASAGNPIRFDHKDIQQVTKSIFRQLWNTYSFYIMYANLDEISPKEFADIKIQDLNSLDKWIIARLQNTINTVNNELSNYQCGKATDCIVKFVDDLSNIWVRASRNRFWNTNNIDKDINAYYTLNYCLIEICKLSAPIIPLLTDSIYKNLVDNSNSIHLCNYPESRELTDCEQSLLTEMELTQEAINQARNLRQEAKIKIRQPLQLLTLPSKYNINNFIDLIKTELNIKEVNIDQDANMSEIILNTDLTDNLLAEGYARELIHAIQSLRKKSGLEVADRIHINCNIPDTKTKDLIQTQHEYIMNEVLAVEWNQDLITEYTTDLKLNNQVINIYIQKV